MHVSCDGLVSQAATKSPFALSQRFATVSGGGSSARVFFPKPAVNPAGIRCVRANGAAVNDGLVESAAAGMTLYELLGVPVTGSLLEIKQAYKQQARKYHPDVSPPDQVEEYTERFIRVQEAYETLSDPRRRALYDREMANGFHLAFSGRKMYQCDEDTTEDKGEWKNRWQSQLSELKRRSKYRDERASSSWGARMRRQSAEA